MLNCNYKCKLKNLKKHLQKSIKKKIKKENETVANRKLGKVGNLGKVIPSFRFCPTAKIENSDLKISKKDFRVFDLTVLKYFVTKKF